MLVLYCFTIFHEQQMNVKKCNRMSNDSAINDNIYCMSHGQHRNHICDATSTVENHCRNAIPYASFPAPLSSGTFAMISNSLIIFVFEFVFHFALMVILFIIPVQLFLLFVQHFTQSNAIKVHSGTRCQTESKVHAHGRLWLLLTTWDRPSFVWFCFFFQYAFS